MNKNNNAQEDSDSYSDEIKEAGIPQEPEAADVEQVGVPKQGRSRVYTSTNLYYNTCLVWWENQGKHGNYEERSMA